MSYNEQEHFRIERNRYRVKNSRYYITKYRRLRKLSKSGVPVDLSETGGEVVTKTEEARATKRAVLIGRGWWD